MAASVDLLAVGRKKPPRKVWAVLVLALAATAAVAARYMAQAIQ
jgi:hypothetical protein